MANNNTLCNELNPITSSSRKLMAASSSTVSFKVVLRNWMSNWICWNPLRLKVCSRTNSCKLFRQSFSMVVTTDSCNLQEFLFDMPQTPVPLIPVQVQTCVCSTFVKISIFCLNNLARCVSRSWLLALWVFDRSILSSRNGLLREELVLPLLSVRRCLRWIPWGKICFTSVPIASN